MTGAALSYILALGTVLGDIAAFLLLGLLFMHHPIRPAIRKIAMPAVFVLSLFGVIISLVYSEGLHYLPCTLCWYERILLYPQPILLAIALVKRDRNVARYIAWLSGIGIVIALYHQGLQMGWFTEGILCGVGATVSCAKRYVMEFGYITIPMMALTSFALTFLLSLHALSDRTR